MARRKKSRNRAVRAPKLPKSLEQVNLNAAGIDCGATEHYVAVPEDRDAQPVRKFGTFTSDLAALVDWLVQCGIDTVAMESTGVYWIPLFEMLEVRGIRCFVVDPRRLKNVPGRKSDVLDCQWIQQLHTFGLLRGSFRPDDAICVLRSYMRHRDVLVSYAGQHIQHIQKALEQMNIKLTEVIADVVGVTGLSIIDAILAGERNPNKLAQLRHYRCRNPEETIALALQGNWRDEHLFALRQAVELFRFYHEKMTELDSQIESYLDTLPDKTPDSVPPQQRSERRTRNKPLFSVTERVLQLCGVDLTTLDGFQSGYNALQLISEIGSNVSAWPTEKHFASWLGLCPGIKKTGGRWLSGARPKNASRGAQILRMAAYTLLKSKSALGAYLRRLKTRMGTPKAVTATAHKLARIVYRMLKYGKPYTDAGMEYYEQKYRERVLTNLCRRAADFGYALVPEIDVPPIE
jgi:transposase